jgi:pyridoxine kinase
VNILSIQSAVTYGHVGNSAAVFPLQRLGANVWPINTVQFSNHPGYGAHTGEVCSPEAVAALLDGLAARGVLTDCDALLSGYIGDPGTGAVLLTAAARLREANPRALWCCDPVIGDAAPGVYVRPGIPAFFRDQAVPAADLLTPNLFELQQLTGMPCVSMADTMRAVSALQAGMRDAGPRVCLVTSVRVEDTPDDALDLLVGAGGAFHRLRLPLLPFRGNGAGDMIAALFLFHMLKGGRAAVAMEAAAAAVHGVIARTLAAGSRELLLVEAQEEICRPSVTFAAEACR